LLNISPVEYVCAELSTFDFFTGVFFVDISESKKNLNDPNYNYVTPVPFLCHSLFPENVGKTQQSYLTGPPTIILIYRCPGSSW